MIPATGTAIGKEILELITHSKVATVCCSRDNTPHCFNCFYAVLEQEGCIVFKSSETTTHMQIISANSRVAGTIIASETSLTKVEGLQFEGAIDAANALAGPAARAYYLRYPFAVAMPGRIWILQLNTIKYTHTSHGITHKSAWQR